MFNDSQLKIYNYINSFQISVGIATLVRLNIPDILLSGSKTFDELAKQVKVNAKSLLRLLNALVAEKILDVEENGKFKLNDVSKVLTKNEPGSLYSSTAWYDACGYQSWLKLCDSLMQEKCAFEIAFDRPFFEHIKKSPPTAKNFNDSQIQITKTVIKNIIDKFPFSKFKTIVDVGGGSGQLISAILSAYPTVNGILVDMPEVVNTEKTKLITQSIAERLHIIAGSFFDTIPSGGDLYMLKYILHDWPDKDALRILQNCRKAMSRNSRLIIIEILVSEDHEETFSKWRDLEMMVLFDAKERTQSEFEALLQQANLQLTRTVSVDGVVHILEAKAILSS